MRLSASFWLIIRKIQLWIWTTLANKLCFLWCLVGPATDIWLDHLGCCWTGEPREQCHTAEGRRTGTEPDAECNLPPGKPHLGLPVACTSSGLFFFYSGSIGYYSGVTAHWTFSFCFSVVWQDISKGLMCSGNGDALSQNTPKIQICAFLVILFSAIICKNKSMCHFRIGRQFVSHPSNFK